ncbi:hypothetical protein TNCV_3028641 [Trichonephila clavipes]|nr:hypothetical protein TNCV_3028641 [Trichonephila clavipes]
MGTLPQEMLHQLVLSMRRRCEATIANVTADLLVTVHTQTDPKSANARKDTPSSNPNVKNVIVERWQSAVVL